MSKSVKLHCQILRRTKVLEFFFLGAFLDLWPFLFPRLLVHFSLSIVVMLTYLFSQETVEALLLFREYNEKAVDLWRQERN